MPRTVTHPNGDTYVQSDEYLAALRTAAINATHHASWSWNEEAGTYLPPSNPPDDGQGYIWNEAGEAWVEFPG